MVTTCAQPAAIRHASNTKDTRHLNSSFHRASSSIVALCVSSYRTLHILPFWFWYQIGWLRPSIRISKCASAHVRPDYSTSSHHDLSVTSAPSPLLHMPLAQFTCLWTLRWPPCCRSCRLLPTLAITGIASHGRLQDLEATPATPDIFLSAIRQYRLQVVPTPLQTFPALPVRALDEKLTSQCPLFHTFNMAEGRSHFKRSFRHRFLRHPYLQ